MTYQLSHEATQLGAGQFVGLICSGEETITRSKEQPYITTTVFSQTMAYFWIEIPRMRLP